MYFSPRVSHFLVCVGGGGMLDIYHFHLLIPLSIEFILIRLFFYTSLLEGSYQDHHLLSVKENRQFSAFTLLSLLTASQHHLLNPFLLETSVVLLGNASFCPRLCLGESFPQLPLLTSFFSFLLLLAFRKLSPGQCLQKPWVWLTLWFARCTDVLNVTCSLFTRYSHLLAQVYKIELLSPPSFPPAL